MGPKRRKTGNAAPTGVKRSDHETISALVERLVQCHEENSLDTSRDDFKVTIDANLPDNVKLGAHQAASILQGAITELQAAIDVAATLTNRPQAPVASTIEQAKELVAYAHRLSFTTSAPPGFIPGQTPLLHFKPPAPQEIQLRSSALHQFHREYELKLKEGQRVAAYSAEKKATTTAEKASIIHPADEIKETTVPVNLAGILSNLPPMPAGWKPGDPIPGLPAGLAEAGPSLAAAAAAAPAQEMPPTSTAAIPTATKPPQTLPIPTTAPIASAPVSTQQQQQQQQRPISAFDFSLNPDMELEFDVGESSGDDSEDDSDSD